MYDKKMSAVFLSAVMLLCGLCFPAAQSRKLSNGNELESFKGRTKEQITSLWQTAEIADYESIFEEGKQSSYVAPYSGGTVRQECLTMFGATLIITGILSVLRKLPRDL